MTAVSGNTGTLTGTADLPTLSDGAYIALSGFSNEENNGVYQVTDAAPTTSAIDVTKLNGDTLVVEGTATVNVDENPVNSPAAIIVNNNSGAPITGNVPGASTSFDFDYSNNVQGGRTGGTAAPITIRAIGTDTAQFVETTGTIVQATGQTFSLVAALERNYSNPA